MSGRNEDKAIKETINFDFSDKTIRLRRNALMVSSAILGINIFNIRLSEKISPIEMLSSIEKMDTVEMARVFEKVIVDSQQSFNGLVITGLTTTELVTGLFIVAGYCLLVSLWRSFEELERFWFKYSTEYDQITMSKNNPSDMSIWNRIKAAIFVAEEALKNEITEKEINPHSVTKFMEATHRFYNQFDSVKDGVEVIIKRFKLVNSLTKYRIYVVDLILPPIIFLAAVISSFWL